jgi:glycopeptide antibiotics resistance protein
VLSQSVALTKPVAIVWVFPAVAGIVALAASRTRPPAVRRRAIRFVRMLFICYLAGIIVITLWPLHFDAAHHGLEKGNRIPFHGTLAFVRSNSKVQQRIGDLDFLANVLLYIPFGLLLPFVVNRPGGVLVALALGAGCALGFELVQGAFVVGRTFDIDDAITGFAGVALGTAVASLLGPIVRIGYARRR